MALIEAHQLELNLRHKESDVSVILLLQQLVRENQAVSLAEVATWLQLLYIYEIGHQMDPLQKISCGNYHELGFVGDFTIIEVEMIITRIHNLDGG